ncbi:chromatin remodelling complex Rsc7/Swp82 subunit-domain-containing protein [Pseudomassariella vexata]|uniref:Chromatin remodelling complex Rsc7/Swp82 subunit-domain-containing protein n=1 Tax=Pseudomassariella vexata TaxID=1141098 RepID=A0A1Y2DD10_9PEZI|nr:chromatin remodelling complex Rsc7/Swp82 subunit-domain-containing protein [Pseudomassariella vexata]ORY56575.1 chromatin remodelling complex Rsc7/Swp82 subunit-domain-containing protein [Pseudomassariella vexata]
MASLRSSPWCSRRLICFLIANHVLLRVESTPKTFEEMDDEPMADADGDQDAEQDGSDAEAQLDVEDNDGDSVAEPEEDNQESDAQSVVKSPTPPPVPVIRKRRLGRPPKNRPPDWDQLPIERPERDPNETPRRRGRGGYRGRGGRKGQSFQPTQQAIDKDGAMADIVDDELALPEDAEGETKVDRMGNLQGGREYRCRTFTVQGRGDRLYMLSTEPARCVGFRDSYLFFTKHKRLYKIIVDEEEKRDMIEREIIPHSYKGRSIGIVTARSVFREFGSFIIVGGRTIIDDYEVAAKRAEGVVEGEIADPNDRIVDGEEYNKNQYVAWHGASSVYHTGAPSVPVPNGKVDVKKKRVTVTDSNWQLEHARAAAQFNAEIGAIRRANLKGVYDIHTNMVQFPTSMQPTRARIEQVADSSAPTDSKVFPPLDPKVPRNFKVVDTIMELPPAGLAPAAYDQNHNVPDFLKPFQGLSAISDEIKDLLPPECRKPFEDALAQEKAWKAGKGPESETMHRRQPIIDASVVPYHKT